VRYQQAAIFASRSEAGLDGLTGVANRRSLDQTLTREWARAARAGTPLGLVMLDVDLFKPFNDRYGHPAGDGCLARVGGVLQRALHRAGDVAARYGGEEFAALLPDTDLPGTLAVAEALRAGVAALGLEHAESPHRRVTVSAGAASFSPAPGEPEGGLVRAADAALYRAKQAGRNRVEAAEPDRPAAEPPGVSPDELLGHARRLGQAWELALRRARETGRRIDEQVGRLVDQAPPRPR
jgi:diguanylate cyclase (GGDEF)-like protein